MSKSEKKESLSQKSGSQVMIDTLLNHGVTSCWGYPGGAILPFYDAMYNSQLAHYLTRHEQGAVHAAEGYAKATGKLGVCIATSGPGATNLMTGIADAQMDSVSILAITGQVSTSVIGTDAFQEVDTFGMSSPITKYNALIKSADDISRLTKEAILVSTSNRPGPSLLDFPKDCQISLTENLDSDVKISSRHYEKPTLTGDFEALAKAINNSKSPLLYIGGGAITSNASKNIRILAEKAQIPVVSTLMALGAFPGNHTLSLGMMGMHGTAYANKAVIECDFILSLAARFDDRVAGDTKDFASNALIKAQIDIDAAEFDKRVTVDIHIQGDLNEALDKLIPLIEPLKERAWVKRITQLKEENPLRFNLSTTEIKPQYVIHRLWQKTKGEAIITTDVGQHQMWAAQYYPFNQPRQWITSGGLGTMGFGFPAALGAKVGVPHRETIVISGDGSFQMCMQELATAKMYNIPVKILLFNNGFLGMVRQWQELFYGKRFSQSVMNYNPDFVKIVDGFDLPAKRITRPDEIEEGLDFLLNTKECTLLEVAIPEEEKVYPMISSGAKYIDMIDFNHKNEEGTPFTIIPNREIDSKIFDKQV